MDGDHEGIVEKNPDVCRIVDFWLYGWSWLYGWLALSEADRAKVWGTDIWDVSPVLILKRPALQ